MKKWRNRSRFGSLTKASSAVFGEPTHFSQSRLRRPGESVSVS
jgi:hypothetical protein